LGRGKERKKKSKSEKRKKKEKVRVQWPTMEHGPWNMESHGGTVCPSIDIPSQ
jgi:hypothetical protein